jgi:hypothetical protein
VQCHRGPPATRSGRKPAPAARGWRCGSRCHRSAPRRSSGTRGRSAPSRRRQSPRNRGDGRSDGEASTAESAATPSESTTRPQLRRVGIDEERFDPARTGAADPREVIDSQPIGTHISLDRSYTEVAVDKPLRLKYESVRSVADDAALARVDGRSKAHPRRPTRGRVPPRAADRPPLLARRHQRPQHPARAHPPRRARARRALPHHHRRRRHPPLPLLGHQGRLRLRQDATRTARPADPPRRTVARAQGHRPAVCAAQPACDRLDACLRAGRRTVRARLARPEPPARPTARATRQRRPRVGQPRCAAPHSAGEHGHPRPAVSGASPSGR